MSEITGEVCKFFSEVIPAPLNDMQLKNCFKYIKYFSKNIKLICTFFYFLLLDSASTFGSYSHKQWPQRMDAHIWFGKDFYPGCLSQMQLPRNLSPLLVLNQTSFACNVHMLTTTPWKNWLLQTWNSLFEILLDIGIHHWQLVGCQWWMLTAVLKHFKRWLDDYFQCIRSSFSLCYWKLLQIYPL